MNEQQTPKQRPMFYWGWITLIIAGAIWLLTYLMFTPESKQEHIDALPWHAQVNEQGNLKVLGLTLNESSTRDAMALYGKEIEIMLFTDHDTQPISVESFFESMHIGYAFRGRLVLTLNTNAAQLDSMLQRGGKVKSLDTGHREITLSGQDLHLAVDLPIKYLTFIPQSKIDESIIEQRFGQPTRDYEGEDGLRRWSYPEKQLTVIFDGTGRKVLEFGHNDL